MRVCFSEETDGDFIRWTANLLLTFLREGSVSFVRRNESPQLMIASIWRLFGAHAPLRKYKAVIGLYHPKDLVPSYNIPTPPYILIF
jgi:hypothetical protein